MTWAPSTDYFIDSVWDHILIVVVIKKDFIVDDPLAGLNSKEDEQVQRQIVIDGVLFEDLCVDIFHKDDQIIRVLIDIDGK